MSDNQHRYGFRWSIGVNGSSMPQPLEHFVADAYQGQNDGAGYSVDLNVGDPIKLVSDGSVALANNGDVIYGIMVGVSNVYDPGQLQARPGSFVPGGSTGGGNLSLQTRIMVIPAHWGFWEIDADDNSTFTTEAAYKAVYGQNLDFVCPGDNTISGRPKADPKIDISTHATTNTLSWRFMYLAKSLWNKDYSGLNVKLIVALNKSNFAGWPASGNIVAGV